MESAVKISLLIRFLPKERAGIVAGLASKAEGKNNIVLCGEAPPAE